MVCDFNIHWVQYQNGHKSFMTYFTNDHSYCVVKSGRYSLYCGCLSDLQVNSCNPKARLITSSVEIHPVFTSIIHRTAIGTTSAKINSSRAEWLRQTGLALSEPSETPRWWLTPRPASISRVASHIALPSQFHSFFSLCRSPILNEHSGVQGQL